MWPAGLAYRWLFSSYPPKGYFTSEEALRIYLHRYSIVKPAKAARVVGNHIFYDAPLPPRPLAYVDEDGSIDEKKVVVKCETDLAGSGRDNDL